MILPGVGGCIVGGAAGGGSPTFTLTVASGKTASDLSNYPIYVNLADMPAGFWSAVSSDGGNVRVYASDGTTQVPFDMVVIDTSGHTGTMFVKATTLATATANIFKIKCDGVSLLAAGDTYGRNACWSAFDLVFLGENATTFIDRSGNRSNGSKATGTVSLSAISKAAGFGLDYATAKIVFTGLPGGHVFTIGGTAKSDVATESGHMTWLGVGDPSVASVRAGLVVRNDSPGDNWNQWDDQNSWIATDSGVALSTTERRCHAVYNNTTNRKLYIDGALNTTSGGITAHGATRFAAGCTNNDLEFFDGKIGFCYVISLVLSADYLAAEYSNLNAPSSFYAIT